MRKVYQTDFTSENGNCVQASVATLLGVDLDQVEQFNGAEQRRQFVEFMGRRMIGVAFFPITHPAAMNTFEYVNRFLNAECLLAVESFHHPDRIISIANEKFKVGHCVVGRIDRGRVVVTHDPNPENADRPPSDYEVLEIMLFHQVELI